MDNDNKFATRTSSEERKWLISLGSGSLIEGVRILIQRVNKRNQRGKKSNKSKE